MTTVSESLFRSPVWSREHPKIRLVSVLRFDWSRAVSRIELQVVFLTLITRYEGIDIQETIAVIPDDLIQTIDD